MDQAAPKLRKLFMLSSDRDGEVISGARAIEPTLRASGLDWHDLANGLLATASHPPSPRTNEAAGEWRQWHAFCFQRMHMLGPREAKFIHGLNSWRGVPSTKQLKWLQSIFDRLQQEAAA
jgi:hypothetical protein